MKQILITLALIAGASAPAAADEVMACFGRNYDNKHLAANPRQQVKSIRARLIDLSQGVRGYDMRITFRNDPREFSISTACQREKGRSVCAVDCDGGVMTPSMTKDGRLQLVTSYLRAEISSAAADYGGCAAPVTRDIADKGASGQGARTTFLLYPRNNGECAWSD